MAVVVDRKTKLTYEDYLQFPEDGRRHEIIDGDHYVTAAPFAGEHADRIAVACTGTPDGEPVEVDLREVW